MLETILAQVDQLDTSHRYSAHISRALYLFYAPIGLGRNRPSFQRHTSRWLALSA
jgi:hypothetical protein